MVPIVFLFIRGNLLVSLVVEYHFPCARRCLNSASWNKGIAFILKWHICHPTMVLQGRGSWTFGWMSPGFVFCNSVCSNSGVLYGQSKSTLNTICRPKHEGMSSWKEFFPIYLKILYEPYHKGFSFLYGLVKRSFLRCNHTRSPIWNEWEKQFLWCWTLYFTLAHCNISCASFGCCIFHLENSMFFDLLSSQSRFRSTVLIN